MVNSTQILINIGLGFLTIFVFGGILALIKWTFKSITDKINIHQSHIEHLNVNAILRPEFNAEIKELQGTIKTQHAKQDLAHEKMYVKMDELNSSLHGAEQAFITAGGKR